MIVLKIERNPDGTQRPIELQIEDNHYKYSYDSESNPNEEFFNKLRDFQNYRIGVKYYAEGVLLKETNHVIKTVFRNTDGIMTIELD